MSQSAANTGYDNKYGVSGPWQEDIYRSWGPKTTKKSNRRELNQKMFIEVEELVGMFRWWQRARFL
jgi:hypothetical protein